MSRLRLAGMLALAAVAAFLLDGRVDDVAAGAPPTAALDARVVVGVVDGDTIDLADGTRVRLAITDTPEIHNGAEPCGPEAARFTEELVLDRPVTLRRPAAAPSHDQYGRTVAEVVTADGTSLNVALVAAGLGEIDLRYVHEDPDLARRLTAAANSAARQPTCST